MHVKGAPSKAPSPNDKIWLVFSNNNDDDDCNDNSSNDDNDDNTDGSSTIRDIN